MNGDRRTRGYSGQGALIEKTGRGRKSLTMVPKTRQCLCVRLCTYVALASSRSDTTDEIGPLSRLFQVLLHGPRQAKSPLCLP